MRINCNKGPLNNSRGQGNTHQKALQRGAGIVLLLVAQPQVIQRFGAPRVDRQRLPVQLHRLVDLVVDKLACPRPHTVSLSDGSYTKPSVPNAPHTGYRVHTTNDRDLTYCSQCARVGHCGGVSHVNSVNPKRNHPMDIRTPDPAITVGTYSCPC